MSRNALKTGHSRIFQVQRGLVLLVLFPWLFLASCNFVAKTQPAVSEAQDSYSVVVSGHLYSLYVRNKTMIRDEPIFDEGVLETFAGELGEIAPKATFFLGDNTRFAFDEEWEMLNRVFVNVGGQKVFAAGNHDHRDIQKLEANGGVRNKSIVIGRNKFVVLDSKTIFNQSDLEFIEREVVDHESYDNVFVMMHFVLAGAGYPEGEIDPYAQFKNQSNWNRDVVPLIAGKVDYVFTGDYYPRHVGRMVQHVGEHEINYVRNSFMFRRGLEDNQTGDGPMIYLELRFEGSDFSIVPHALAVDVKSDWFEDLNVLGRFKEGYIYETGQFKSDWNKHLVEDAFTLPLPDRWNVQIDDAEAVLRVTDESNSIDLSVYQYDFTQPTSFAQLGESLVEEATGSNGRELTIEERGRINIHGIQAVWTISELFRDTETKSGLNLWFLHKGVGYLIT